MSIGIMFWMAVCAAAIFALGRGASAAPWRIAEQPELKQQFEQAPVLQTESLGEPARGGECLGALGGAKPGRQELGCTAVVSGIQLGAAGTFYHRPRHGAGEEGAPDSHD